MDFDSVQQDRVLVKCFIYYVLLASQDPGYKYKDVAMHCYASLCIAVPL